MVCQPYSLLTSLRKPSRDCWLVWPHHDLYMGLCVCTMYMATELRDSRKTMYHNTAQFPRQSISENNGYQYMSRFPSSLSSSGTTLATCTVCCTCLVRMCYRNAVLSHVNFNGAVLFLKLSSSLPHTFVIVYCTSTHCCGCVWSVALFLIHTHSCQHECVYVNSQTLRKKGNTTQHLRQYFQRKSCTL